MSGADSSIKTGNDRQVQDGSTPAEACSKASGHKSKSMHDGVPVWYDCCSCEAEPYWLEADDETDTEPRVDPARAET